MITTETTPVVPTLNPADVGFLDIIGDLVEQWGFNRQTGSIWALLYLYGEPLNPRQIQEALVLSAGSVNSLLAELQSWGAIKRIRVSGDRQLLFRATTADLETGYQCYALA